VGEIKEVLDISERRTCRAIQQPISTQRYQPLARNDEYPLTQRITTLAAKYGRYGYRRITAMLQHEGWQVNHKRVERIWRSEGLKVPQRQPKRGRLWLNDGSCVRLRAAHPNYHVWSYDFVMDKTHDGRPFRILNIIDEFTRESLTIMAKRNLKSEEVLECLTELFCTKGIPDFIRSDNGSEFSAKQVRKWLNELGVKALFIEPGSPWENGYIESFNGNLRDELLNREIFYTLEEAIILIEIWRKEYNQVRPHSSLGYRPPTPETVQTNLLGNNLLVSMSARLT
jgi:transposase InsO family protein